MIGACSTGSLTISVDVDPAIERLLTRAVKACERESLFDSLGLFAGLLDAPGCLIEAIKGPPLQMRLKPFAELALLDVAEIASNRSLDSGTRERRIAETFALAGLRR